MEVRFDLEKDEVVLTTKFSHRAFSVKRQFCCRECGTVNKNPLVEALRAAAIYEVRPKTKDVSDAILAYDLEEILRGEDIPKAKRYAERKRRADGVEVRSLKKVTFEELGELE